MENFRNFISFLKKTEKYGLDYYINFFGNYQDKELEETIKKIRLEIESALSNSFASSNTLTSNKMFRDVVNYYEYYHPIINFYKEYNKNIYELVVYSDGNITELFNEYDKESLQKIIILKNIYSNSSKYYFKHETI